jgi:2-oxoglutarate ferredoxin oxidoreductase subunit alpha
MVELREQKVQGVAKGYGRTVVHGDEDARVLVLGWGSTYGAIRTAVERLLTEGKSVAQVHLRNLWPLPLDLEGILERFDKILIPELNRGQLVRLIRAEYLVDAISMPKVQGKPFTATEIAHRVKQLLNESGTN